MKDIETREDIELLLRKFYAVAFYDDVIGFYFTEIAKLDLEKHLPVITDFWETVLFGVAKYKNNAIAVHNPLHAMHAFEDKHFDRWVKLFTEAIANNFEGAKAELAKQRAHSIATVMKIKIVHGGITNHGGNTTP
jgi:hemoglobin